MQYRKFIYLSACCIALISFSVTASDFVLTQHGSVQGTESRDESVEVFKGIPYAAPPVGDLRWHPPQPPAQWSSVRVCDQFAP